MKLRLIIQYNLDQENHLRYLLSSVDADLVSKDELHMIETNSLNTKPLNWDDYSQISAIWDAAREFIQKLNGVARLELKKWELVEFKNVKVLRKYGKWEWMPIGARIKLTDDIISIGSTSPKTDKSTANNATISQLALTILKNDQAVVKVLCLLNKKLDWVNMYRIYEVIEEDCKDNDIDLDLKSTDIDKFKASANNASVAGDDARHGKLNSTLPTNYASIAEAKSTIRELTIKWIRRKTVAKADAWLFRRSLCHPFRPCCAT